MAPRSRHLLQICRRCICTVNSGFDTARLLLCHPSATLTSRTGTPPQPVRHGTALSPSSASSATPTPQKCAGKSTTLTKLWQAFQNTVVRSPTISRDHREKLPSHLATLQERAE